MAENNDLYFIQMLQKAFKDPDKRQALLAAIEEIKAKGKMPEYRGGFKNFRSFIKVLDEYASTEPDIVSGLKAEILETKIIDILTDTFAGSEKEKQAIIDVIKADSGLMSEYQALKAELEEFLSEESAIFIEIEKDGHLFTSFGYTQSSELTLIGQVFPGNYTIKLSTGFLIWQGELTERELIWTEAFPHEKVKAAAETKAIGRRSSHSEPLLNGELIL
jgi:hypothetical protein